MDREAFQHQNGEQTGDRLEKAVRILAGSLPYPATPDIVSQIDWGTLRPLQPKRRSYRLAWAALAIITLIIATMTAVPTVRAQVLEWILLGAVRIFLVDPTPTLDAIETTPSSSQTPALTPTYLPTVLNLSGKTTLEEAYEDNILPIRVPTYPPDLGLPNHVFMQDTGWNALIMAWVHPENPAIVRLALFQVASSQIAFQKFQPVIVAETTVNGVPALWTSGPYILKGRDGDMHYYRIVEGHALIWVEHGITYRIETGMDMETAVRIAESLEWYEPSQNGDGTPTP